MRKRRTPLGIMLMLLLTGVLASAFTIQPVRASGAIYIRANGSIDPPTAPIQRNGDLYTLTGNIISDADGIVIERNNMTLDGAGYTLQGPGEIYSYGIALVERSNVTIRNMKVKIFWSGIGLVWSSNNSISGNNITNNDEGIYLGVSSNNSIIGNNIANNNDSIRLDSASNSIISGNNITANNENGILLLGSSGNSVFGNSITANYFNGICLSPLSNNNSISGNNIKANNEYGIKLRQSSDNIIIGNDITNNRHGIGLDNSSDNSVSENNIANNTERGIWSDSSSGNKFYHNNFISNTIQVYPLDSVNVWDDGYPSGGNYWSDYAGVDVKKGPNQDQPGSDGLGDVAYAIDENNRDRYPLMNPYGSPPPPTFALTITTTAGSTTNPEHGIYTYSQGQTVPVTAIPDTYYRFDHWELDGVNTGSANPNSVLMDTDHTLHAIFVFVPIVPITGRGGPGRLQAVLV